MPKAFVDIPNQPPWYRRILERIEHSDSDEVQIVLTDLAGLRKRKEMSYLVEVQAKRPGWGGTRAQLHACLEGYAHPWDGGYVVAIPNAHEVRRTGFAKRVHLDRFLDNLASPVQRPTIILDRVDQWPDLEHQHVAIDVETDSEGAICRVGLASEHSTLTAPWDHRAFDLVQHVARHAQTIICHNVAFDVPKLEKEEGVQFEADLWCTMEAHRYLYPQSKVGLGYAAPFYALIEPWKHLDDPELYNGMDAWITRRMFDGQQHAQGFREVLPGILRLREMERRGYLVTENGRTDRCHSRYVDKRSGFFSAITGQMEARNPPLPPPWGKRRGAKLAAPAELHDVRLDQPVRELVAAVTGADPTDPNGDARAFGRYLLGGRRRKALDEANPAFVKWRDGLRRRAKKEGFVTNVYGRRLLYPADPVRFFLLSSVQDRILRELPPDAILMHEKGFVLRHDGFAWSNHDGPRP